MASLHYFLSLTLTLTLLTTTTTSQSSPPPPQSLTLAAETLENSGHTAMSLTLRLITPSLPLPSTPITSLTIFSPPNSAFISSGQPSLSTLLLHFSPLSLSPNSLSSLPFSSTLPSLSSKRRLTVTSTNNVSIDNIPVSQYPIFDDGYVVVYSIANFFDLDFNFTGSVNITTNITSDTQCTKLGSVSIFEEASGVMKSRGYSIFAAFIELQLVGYVDGGVKWTVFAPVDEEMVKYSGDFLNYGSLFKRHVVACRVKWSDLDGMRNGSLVSESVEGFGLVVTKDGEGRVVMVNGVEVMLPDMYDSESLVVHGIRGVIGLPEEEEVMGLMEGVKRVVESSAADRGEF